MTWDYRVLRKRHEKTGEYFFGIYECFMDEEGGIWACTKDSVEPSGGTLSELTQETLDMGSSLSHALREGVLDYDCIPEQSAINPASEAIEEIESGEAETISWEEIREKWLADREMRKCVCFMCAHWRKRSPSWGYCKGRGLGVMNEDFDPEMRYVKTKGNDWCAVWKEREVE